MDREQLRREIATVADPMGGQWELHFSDVVPRIAIWCSKQEHWLLDLLRRHQAGELGVEIAFILSNHEVLRRHAEPLGLPFHVLPITRENKAEQEARQLALLNQERLVLARAVRLHLHHRVLTYGNKTMVFE